jgi:hypothetical protein
MVGTLYLLNKAIYVFLFPDCRRQIDASAVPMRKVIMSAEISLLALFLSDESPEGGLYYASLT